MPRTLKHALASLALALLCFGTAHADTITYTGNTFLNPAGRFNRPQENGTLSPIGTSVPYSVLQFTVSAGGSYSFLSVSTEPVAAFYDPFLVLYSGGFNPTSPLAGFVVANEDLNGSRVQSGFTTTLAINTSYFLVTTGSVGAPGVAFFDAGAFRNTISGPGIITAGPGADPIPEPTTMLLLGTGLVGIGAVVRKRRRATRSEE